MEERQHYSVDVEAAGPPVDDDAIDRLMEALEVLEAEAPIVSAGGGVNGVGVTFSVGSATPEEAVQQGLAVFRAAIEKAALPIFAIERVEAITEAAQTVALNTGGESFVGVAEIAQILGVSKQRVYELREKPTFPQPVARLRSGPVWQRSMLNRFIAEWPRRRTGRPPKTRVEELAATLAKSVKAAQKQQYEQGVTVGANARKTVRKAAAKAGRKRVAS
ncbi:MAG: helix-turn-helix transcriptional regulator [Actinomycetota bacterium]